MTISEVASRLEADMLCGYGERDVLSAFGSDMMSDVLAFAKKDAMMLTGMVNPQVIRTAEMMDIGVVAFVRGKRPGDDMIRLADERGIVLLASPLTMFTACGRLYAAGLRGGDEAGA